MYNLSNTDNLITSRAASRPRQRPNLVAFFLGAAVLLLGHLPMANAQWYVGPGITNFNLETSNSTVDTSGINLFGGAQNGQTSTDLESDNATPTLAIGRVFGSDNQWTVESTIGAGSDGTITVNGQPFATLSTLPLNAFVTYQGKRLAFGNWSGAVRPIIGAGLVYATQSNTAIVDPVLSNFGNPKLKLSSSLGVAGLLGVNVELASRISLVVAMSYVTGLTSDVSLQNSELNFGGFVALPATNNDLGSIDLSVLITSARIQFAF